MKKDENQGSKLLRKGRVSLPGARYFISTFKAKGSANLDNKPCFKILVEELNKLEQENICYCLALVVMPDHLHMIITLGPETDLSRAMKLFKGRTAREINKTRGTRGAVWYEGFHDHLIRADEPLQNFLDYILANSVKKDLAKTPNDWPYLLIDGKSDPLC